MRKEVFRLWHLLQKRQHLKDDAASLRSPGFEPRYGSSYSTGAGFEDKVIAAVDMQEQIDEAVLACVQSIEEDYWSIRQEYAGQSQRIHLLRTVCSKSLEDIGEMLNLSLSTVKRRLQGVAEKPDALEDMRLLPVDAGIEDHICQTYDLLQQAADEKYAEVEQLIRIHRQRAIHYRKEYGEWQRSIDDMDSTTRHVVTKRLSGLEWRDVADDVGLSVRQAQRKYNEAGGMKSE